MTKSFAVAFCWCRKKKKRMLSPAAGDPRIRTKSCNSYHGTGSSTPSLSHFLPPTKFRELIGNRKMQIPLKGIRLFPSISRNILHELAEFLADLNSYRVRLYSWLQLFLLPSSNSFHFPPCGLVAFRISLVLY